MNIMKLSYPLTEDIRRSVPPQGQTMAIGDFDGVHVGHREVVQRAVHHAQRLGISSSVMTFHPHPREVLGAPAYSTWITPLPRKLELLEQIGVDTVYVFSFDKSFASLPPDRFVSEVLEPLGVVSVTVGFNFTFGHKGLGTSAMLKELGAGSFTVDIVEPKLVDGDRVSSTSIREALADGDVERVSAFLGRPFSLSGQVVAGDGRGRTIGVPTANMAISERVVRPANGVYAVRVSIDTGPQAGTTAFGVMNVGVKPTFHDALPEPTWEVHLLDFQGDLYDQQLTATFLFRIRSERKFASVEELIERIGQDIAETRQKMNSRG